MATDTGLNSLNAFLYTWGSYRSKNIAKSRWSMLLRFGRHPQETGVEHCRWPPATTRAGCYTAATEPHIWPNVYLALALPREPIRIVRAQQEQTVPWLKHGDASCSHGTFRGSRAAIPWDSLQVAGPFQCPRVYEPHAASVACTWSAVAGAPAKVLCMLCGILVPVSGCPRQAPRKVWPGYSEWERHTG